MRVLHTSDQYINQAICDSERDVEFAAFLTWFVGYRREGKEAEYKEEG